MTARFERLGLADQLIIIGLLSSLTLFLFPVRVDAQVQNKTRLVFEIKNFPTIAIPDVPEIGDVPSISQPAEIADSEEQPIEPVVDPDIVRDPSGKVYMHEPAIKAYVCPKLKDKCKTFIAILKAENGTHECTRDNKGLNRNGSIDMGLAQINWSKHSPYTLDQLKDCKFNLDIALQKYDARGFSPWVAYTSGRYKKHLKYIN